MQAALLAAIKTLRMHPAGACYPQQSAQAPPLHVPNCEHPAGYGRWGNRLCDTAGVTRKERYVLADELEAAMSCLRSKLREEVIH